MYGDDGRLLQSVVTSEPEWDESQVALLLASEVLQADIGPHGQPMSEATSRDADPGRPGGWYYSAGNVPIVDFAQQALDRAKDAYHKANGDADTAGHVWRVKKVAVRDPRIG